MTNIQLLFKKLTAVKFQYFLVLFFILLVPVFTLEKEFFNIQLNKFHHPFLDLFFKNITHLGDGLVYFPLIILTYFKFKENIPGVFILFVIQSGISLLFKQILMPNCQRPILYLKNSFHLLHQVEGVEIHRYSSFPSGHTMTAFAISFFILFNFSVSNKLKFVLLVLAMLVAISRVYLLQHFYIDVLFGFGFGYLSAIITHRLTTKN